MADKANEDTKVEKTTDPASDQQKQEDIKKEDDDTSSQASGDKNDQKNDDVDYAGEFQRVSTQLQQAEHNIVELRRENKDLKKGKSEDQDDDDSDEVDKKIDQRFSRLEQQLAGNSVAATLAGLSSNPDERKLILFHYENSIKKSGLSTDAILSDLEKAQALANQKRILRENAEIRRTIQTRQNVSNNNRGTNQDKNTGEDGGGVRLTDREKALLARRKLTAKDVVAKATVPVK